MVGDMKINKDLVSESSQIERTRKRIQQQLFINNEKITQSALNQKTTQIGRYLARLKTQGDRVLLSGRVTCSTTRESRRVEQVRKKIENEKCH